MATTHHVQTFLDLPERTARYRLQRLKSLGMAGAVRPYAESGSEPNHWYPTKTSDAWARGAPVPKGGERERPNESFVRHAAAVTGLYVALVRLGPVLGFSVASAVREIEAKEEFETEGRTTCIVPDLYVELSWDDASYRAFVEVDLGTMSLPRLWRKLATYAAYVQEEAWQARHPFPPALLVLTTTGRRAEAAARIWEQRILSSGSRRRAPRFPKARSLALGTSDAVREPESAITEAVWLAPGTVDGLSLRDLLDPPWRRWRDAVERERTEREQREAIERAIWDAPAEHRRQMLRDEARNFFPHSGYMRSSPSEHEKTVAHLLANEGEMTKAERTAFTAFCDRRTEVCGEHLRVAYNLIRVDIKGQEAVAL
ncbi:MAG: replication-relaxation family protein, partial [Actinomycetota bacterium]